MTGNIDFKNDVELRKSLVQVALGRVPADVLVQVGRLLDTGSATWIEDADIVISQGALRLSDRVTVLRAM